MAFRKLIVWQRAHRLVTALFSESRLDSAGAAGLIGRELRRTAMSVAANVAEGSAAPTQRVYARHLGIAIASAAELHYFLIVAADTRVMEPDAVSEMAKEATEIRRMLHGLARHVRGSGGTAYKRETSPSVRS